MSKIIIKRFIGISGGACKMICYIDGNEICRIKENETFVYETQKSFCEFKCQLTLGNPMSNKYNIDFNNGTLVTIDATQGMWKPKVKINYESEKQGKVSDEINLVERIQRFNPTKKIGDYLYIDEIKKEWTIPKGVFSKKVQQIYDYSDILSYELIEDGNSISKGGIGRALVGGALFGGVGAIVGGVTGHKTKSTCTRLQIKITLNSTINPIEYITLISTETKKSSFIYNSAYNVAQQILSMLEIICNNNSEKTLTTQDTVSKPIDDVDEILKYKNLLDKGIISKEEFEAKKKKILGI